MRDRDRDPLQYPSFLQITKYHVTFVFFLLLSSVCRCIKILNISDSLHYWFSIICRIRSERGLEGLGMEQKNIFFMVTIVFPFFSLMKNLLFKGFRGFYYWKKICVCHPNKMLIFKILENFFTPFWLMKAMLYL